MPLVVRVVFLICPRCCFLYLGLPPTRKQSYGSTNCRSGRTSTWTLVSHYLFCKINIYLVFFITISQTYIVNLLFLRLYLPQRSGGWLHQRLWRYQEPPRLRCQQQEQHSEREESQSGALCPQRQGWRLRFRQHAGKLHCKHTNVSLEIFSWSVIILFTCMWFVPTLNSSIFFFIKRKQSYSRSTSTRTTKTKGCVLWWRCCPCLPCGHTAPACHVVISHCCIYLVYQNLKLRLDALCRALIWCSLYAQKCNVFWPGACVLWLKLCRLKLQSVVHTVDRAQVNCILVWLRLLTYLFLFVLSCRARRTALPLPTAARPHPSRLPRGPRILLRPSPSPARPLPRRVTTTMTTDMVSICCVVLEWLFGDDHLEYWWLFYLGLNVGGELYVLQIV